MIQIHNKSLKNSITATRIIKKIEGKSTEPTIVFFSGIHGNETAGVIALYEVLDKIGQKDVKGNIYAILGNLKALEQNKRYIDTDLNRLWTKENLNSLNNKAILNSEEQEQLELVNLLNEILLRNKGPFYFIDLHTTSSKTLPFITINDALINRNFSALFPVPIVLGIEEYLKGPILSYINELGYVSLGFESGQHDDIEAISNAKAFINLAMVYAKVVKKKTIPHLMLNYKLLKSASKNTTKIFEVVYLHKILKNDCFEMLDGFKSFQKISKGTVLANNNNKKIKSRYSGLIFMPLYQKKGDEGFFVIKKINSFILKCSAALRKLKADSTLVLLPGVSWENKQKKVLKVNLKTAKFLAKELFHLFGYRSQQIDSKHLKLLSRERAAKVELYKKETWYKKPPKLH